MIEPRQFGVDFNLIRQTFARLIQSVCSLDQDHVILEEPESPGAPRPDNPYFSFKITGPANKSGDDSKDNIKDAQGNPTTSWNSGGVRKMTVSFNCYGRSHEEAYNYMTLWQTALDTWGPQETLRKSGIAVWVIGNVADLSSLLNTGYEGRAHLETTFGIAVNLQYDYGEIQTVNVDGAVDTGNSTVDTSQEVIGPS